METNKTATIELASAISTKDLVENIELYSGLVNQVVDSKSLIQLILHEFARLIENYLSISDQQFNQVNDPLEGQKTEPSESYLLHYRLSEPLKSLSLLHRDVLLQLNIASCKHIDEQLDLNAIEKHFLESKNILLMALDSSIKACKQEQKNFADSDGPSRILINKIKHQQNPWLVYKKQFTTILDQFQEIDRSSEAVITLISWFRSLRDHINSLAKQVHQNFESARSLIEVGVTRLKNIKDIKDLNQEIIWIDKILEDRQPNEDHQKMFVNYIERMTSGLVDLNIPIATSDGILMKRKVELNKVTDKWLEYELLPLFIDLWDNEKSLEAYLDLNLINLKNGLVLAGNNKSIDSIQSQISFLESVATSLNENIEKEKEATERIEKLVGNSLVATNIYQKEEFLEVSLQSSFAQYSTVKNTLLDRLKHKMKGLFVDLGTKYEEAHLFSGQKKLEASIECISHRMFKESNNSYDSIFRNRIFIGDLFLVAREEEERMLTDSLGQWQSGFNQAALVVGNHLSGKTTFIEYIAKKHFGRKVIKLEVTSSISVEGRKYQANYNLGGALKFIKNNLYQSKPLIIIDDIEIWRSEEYTLLDNVRAVIKYIESESDDAYVVVSTSKAMQDHLDQRLPFSNSFSTVINLNKSTSEEILEAVLLRHGASHKQLVTSDHITLSPKQIERKVKELSRSLNYNMGKVLQAWTYSSTVFDDQFVIFEDKDHTFRDFFTNEEIIVLKYVVLYKHINEVVLKNFLGSRNEIYMSGLKRLVNTKVLIRDEVGELWLNTVIHHDVIDILKYRGILE